jgi:hypothetical protein
VVAFLSPSCPAPHLVCQGGRHTGIRNEAP